MPINQNHIYHIILYCHEHNADKGLTISNYKLKEKKFKSDADFKEHMEYCKNQSYFNEFAEREFTITGQLYEVKGLTDKAKKVIGK